MYLVFGENPLKYKARIGIERKRALTGGWPEMWTFGFEIVIPIANSGSPLILARLGWPEIPWTGSVAQIHYVGEIISCLFQDYQSLFPRQNLCDVHMRNVRRGSEAFSITKIDRFYPVVKLERGF